MEGGECGGYFHVNFFFHPHILIPSYPHIITPSHPHTVTTTEALGIISEAADRTNDRIKELVCVHVWCVWCVQCVQCVHVWCVWCVQCVHVWCVWYVWCVHVWCVYTCSFIIHPQSCPSLLSLSPLSRRTPIQFSRSSDHCKTTKDPCLGLAEYFSKREC